MTIAIDVCFMQSERMEKALSMAIKDDGSLKLECIETGEVATINEWSANLSLHRDATPRAIRNALYKAVKTKTRYAGLRFIPFSGLIRRAAPLLLMPPKHDSGCAICDCMFSAHEEKTQRCPSFEDGEFRSTVFRAVAA